MLEDLQRLGLVECVAPLAFSEYGLALTGIGGYEVDVDLLAKDRVGNGIPTLARTAGIRAEGNQVPGFCTTRPLDNYMITRRQVKSRRAVRVSPGQGIDARERHPALRENVPV